MSTEYGSHTEFMKGVESAVSERSSYLEKILREAFKKFIRTESMEVVHFSDLTAAELATAIEKFPTVLKPLFVACNVAARAVERDLGIKNLDTYSEKITSENAKIIAGYVRPFLPPVLSLQTLVQLDRVSFIDKEIRKKKGHWERDILSALNKISEKIFVKRKFDAKKQIFELDAAYPQSGDIKIGVDIKRIEARRDIHKRCDEIINKSLKLKEAFPKSKFCAVIYYPFIEEHSNVQDRLRSPAIDSVVFASESKESIFNAVKMLLSKVRAP